MSVVVTFSLCYWLFFLLSICISVLGFVFPFWLLSRFCFEFCVSVLGFAILFWGFLFCFGFCDSVLSFFYFALGFVILFWVLWFCFEFCDSVLGFMTLVWVLWFCFVPIGHRSIEFCDSVLFVSATVHLESFKTNCTQHTTWEKIQVFKHLRQHFINDKSTGVRSCTNLLIEKQAACK